MNSLILVALFLFSVLFSGLSQTKLTNKDNLNLDSLNHYITREVNELRKKAKVNLIAVDSKLQPAAHDHAMYMSDNEKMTHFQKSKIKKTPKNRVDFYGGQFAVVGENVQVNNFETLKKKGKGKSSEIETYEELAEKLVLAWKNSPPHYENLIHPDFKTTYTDVSIGENGQIYACQLFGGSAYIDKYEAQNPIVNYKPENEKKCKSCKKRPPRGYIYILEDNTIVFEYFTPKMEWPKKKSSRMRLYNPWTAGLAADIVLKSQYPCDSNSFFNGRRGVRGIPLEPVYKKDYSKDIHMKYTSIVLGKVPSYINEEFEVNLTVIKRKRTCLNILFNNIRSQFHVEIPVEFSFKPLPATRVNTTIDTLSTRLFFEKSAIVSTDTNLISAISMVKENMSVIEKIEIKGFASIEGSTENNTILYTKRAQFLLKRLEELGVDTSKVIVTTNENFADFRSDIVNTKFDYLLKLSDLDLKQQLLDKQLSNDLEFVLKNHRYVNLEIVLKSDAISRYTKEMVQNLITRNVQNENFKKAEEFQQIQFGLALSGEVTLDEINYLPYPLDKKHLGLLHNRAIINYVLDSTNEFARMKLYGDLIALYQINPDDKKLVTSIAILDYYQGQWMVSSSTKSKFYDSIIDNKLIDKEIKAQILLNFASYVDWETFMSTGSYNPDYYYYRLVQKFVSAAKLNVDKTFEIASYYSFFNNTNYAYSLTKGIIDETTNPDDIIFFLKLIHLTDIELPRKKYVSYFKKAQELAGEKFCGFFNSPDLNFQILDDEEIKEIYCESCSE